MSRVPDQGMLEGIDRIGWPASLENQFGIDEPSKGGLQLVVAKARNRAEQRIRKLAADRRAYLRYSSD